VEEQLDEDAKVAAELKMIIKEVDFIGFIEKEKGNVMVVEGKPVEDEKEILKLLKSCKLIELSKKDVKDNYDFYIIDEGQFHWPKKKSSKKEKTWDNLLLKFYFPHDNTSYFIKPKQLMKFISKYQAIVLVSFIGPNIEKFGRNQKMNL
jgi:hypothetical protein